MKYSLAFLARVARYTSFTSHIPAHVDTPVDLLNEHEAEERKKTAVEPNWFKSTLGANGATPTKTLAEQYLLPSKFMEWKKVSLDFSGSQLSDAQLRELAEFIEFQANSLSFLQLNLSGCSSEDSQSGFEGIFKSLKNSQELKVLAIHLRKPAFSGNDETLAALGKTVIGLHELEEFSLDVSGCKFSTTGIVKLFSDLSRAKKLNEIYLDLSEAKQLTAETFKVISNS